MLKKYQLKIIVCMSLLLMVTVGGFSQHTHFIYFQHEQSASFYVKYQGQILRSSSQGYLILSKLNKGTQVIHIGLSDSLQRTVKFIIDSLQSDKGYLIKDFGDSGWGLFDLQTSVVVYGKLDDGGGAVAGRRYMADSLSGDGFGDMLAKVTKDSTVKYVSVMNPEKKTDTVQKSSISVRADSLLVKNAVATTKTSSIVLLESKEINSAHLFMFTVEGKGSMDTVQVLIENSVVPESNVRDSSKADTVSPVIVPERPSVDVFIPSVSDSVILIQDTVIKPIKSVVKTECSTVADEYFFVKLRQQMAGQMTEEKMIEEALEFFRKVCFTTVQLRRLSLLLTTDEMKYRFFATASRYVSDTHLFPALRNEIQDEIYRKQFDVLIANP
jgi:hypothetical protein